MNYEELLNYNDFARKLNNKSMNEPDVEDQLESLNDLIKKDNIVIFYPKNIHSNVWADQLIIYAFEEEELKIIYFRKDKVVKIEVFKYVLVKKVIINYKKNHSASLEINFSGTVFNFDSNIDFGKNHHSSAIAKILKIYHLLA